MCVRPFCARQTFALASTLALDGAQDAGTFDQSGAPSLLDQYDYAMYGKLYKWKQVRAMAHTHNAERSNEQTSNRARRTNPRRQWSCTCRLVACSCDSRVTLDILRRYAPPPPPHTDVTAVSLLLRAAVNGRHC